MASDFLVKIGSGHGLAYLGTKPLSELMEKFSLKKCILKYRPQNGANFAHASMSLECVRVISEFPQCVKYLTMHHFGTEYIRACTFLLQNGTFWNIVLVHHGICVITLIAKFMGPTWDPPVSCRPQVGLILAP